ncbi:DUF4124 domain-containing protein [Shewanella glacialipiscicola]|uniref:DUF4124 domain-containing protein n=1 Tax=Shewanella glacialipiscicola TaxID=614069 RepID=A0ABQ6J8Y3_9GAMM|nr:DUF4124 domain-containing protein [Shewanella glacialipiscicola]MCL1085738.1 DUF4124 domain-containing protein [Shewanella glacialipiscicola]MCU7995583.1 DUF4124 domain-containing protein [Shewanella glacialipiscicola]MCU8026830.1 DUF4124 domain-containing protein [Shewanella glacialipiscicola]GIU04582.1 hypothetical protein TUM4636_03660 [Shewanella glacialipiscicola]GMA83290.1 hypothetical protein GCM10025855_28230 [Shewanella glacialipiscicola]
MARLILTLICVILPSVAQANTIYKCRKDDKVIFSQTACPQEFSQHKIEYQLGVTTEVDSDKKDIRVDPLQALLNSQSISKEKLLQLLDGEIYRLKQENSYFEILRASELQKLERKRYWQNQEQSDPEYIKEMNDINSHFTTLSVNNNKAIQLLNARKNHITTEASPNAVKESETH